MKNKDEKSQEQISLFDLLNSVCDGEQNLSAAALSDVIEKLQEEKKKALEREDAERRKKEQEERMQRERQERERQEAHIREVTSMELPMDWENVFKSDVRAANVHTESIPDALILSLTTLGRVDIEYISSVTGKTPKVIISALKGSIYQNPETWDECFYKGWETAEEYLSGNLMRKRKVAAKANAVYQGYFSENLEAIDRVLPPAVAAKDIYVTLGSPWVPTDIIDDFIIHILKPSGDREKWTIHDELTGTWEIPNKSRYWNYVRSVNSYGTDRIPALHLLEKTLNMKTVAVTEEVGSAINASGKKRVINKEETVSALEKQEKMIKEFQSWVWKDEVRKERLEGIFEERFGRVRKRTFDGSFLEFPTMSPKVQLYPYQKNAVARILFTPNTLLAHDVGAGKTYVMIAAGMELLRMGISKKNMYVVPNNLVGQWRNTFSMMYPDAKLLCVEPKSFTTQKREKLLERMRDESFDGIIIAYSCFEQIPLSKEAYRIKFEEQRDAINKIATDKNKATSRLKKKRADLFKALKELSEKMDDMYNTVYFDELGITRLFVDEAHNFKNVPVETKANFVLGIGGAGSKKCQDMLDKVRTVQRQNDGKGVVLATGTPITNSITDAFIMQQYLQSGELAMLDLQSFDSWIGMFAERVTEFEIDVDTSSYRLATRFAKFHNLPELTALLSSIADFHQAEATAEIPETDGYCDAVIAKTDAFSLYLEHISRRAELVRHGGVSRRDDNMLKITTDGRKAALDFRLVDPQAAFTYQSKVARCAENILDIYRKTMANSSAQLVFCDTSTPKDGFNLYDELKALLVRGGIGEKEIAYIHEAETEQKKEKLFARVRRGEVRVLLGSTFKLGLGVNIQDRLIALHHLDVPWRPADMTQREGRILRQGNTNSKVFIYRYITEGSFDAYSWQLLETKARFIADLLSGTLAKRSGADIDDTVLNYAEVKALAVGDPLVKQRVETANELTRYQTLQQKLVEKRLKLHRELEELPDKRETQKTMIANCEEDMCFYQAWKLENPPAEDNYAKKAENERRKRLREQIQTAVAANVLEIKERKLFEYRGFELILPANMQSEKPHIFLQRRGRYYVELGDTDVGNLIRIDHVLETLGEHLGKLQKRLFELELQERESLAELAKDENYTEIIVALKEKLDALDKKLGAKKK